MRTTIGVMGSGENGDAKMLAMARDLGQAIAQQGWVLVNGGRNSGVMDASALGARTAGGLVVGILPDETVTRASRHLDIAIRTGMGDGRNYVNVLSSDVVVAMRGGAGTLSEVALALKAGRVVIALDYDVGASFDHFRRTGKLLETDSVDEAILMCRRALRQPAATPPARVSGGDSTPERAHLAMPSVDKLRQAREKR
ncbi:MAG TPA: TIGR00725 family protein [Coriobacteriia bacterium]